MHDQANHLRRLMRAAQQANSVDSTAPRIVVVAGAKGGVGTTTLAINLSVALAREGQRTLLIDADMRRADIANVCALGDGVTLVDVLTGRRTLHEAIQLGPAGIQVLPGRPIGERPRGFTAREEERLIRSVQGLGAHADIVLLDVGSAMNTLVERCWHTASDVLMVTTVDQIAIMDAYATIKMLFEPPGSPRVGVVLNLSSDPELAQSASARFSQACRRFLSLEVWHAATIERGEEFCAARAAMSPLSVHAHDCEAAREIARMATRLVAHTDRSFSAAQTQDAELQSSFH